MASESINRGVWTIGYDLAPGQMHHWVQDGQAWGKVRWFNVFAYLGSYYEFPFSKAVEIERVFSRTIVRSYEDYTFRVEVQVRNIGTVSCNYIIWFAESTGQYPN